ncbi:MAG: response regulator [Verrucomicrobia bacterium]|nr:response regulator [Cytophagales bacterium]
MTAQLAFAFQKVLPVDDDETDLFINKRIIELAHFAAQVVCHNLGKDALAYLFSLPTAKHPEIIFLDLNMPILNGFGVLKSLEHLAESFPVRSKIYMLTSSLSPIDRTQAQQHKCISQYLIKPISEEILYEITQTHPPLKP